MPGLHSNGKAEKSAKEVDMVRLPQPGGDAGEWGEILNTFLSVEHNADGSLKLASDIISAQQKASSAVQRVYGKSPVNGVISYSNEDLVYFASSPEHLMRGELTYDDNGTVIAASIVWPDGTEGQYTALVVSSSFPGAVDAYVVTYGQLNRIRQTTVIRDPETGRVISRPAMIVEEL